MQLKMDLFSTATENKDTVADPVKAPKEMLEQYILVCGLVEYKNFYMKIKNGFAAIPEGMTKENYLTLAREVYESRAAKVNRQKSRSRFFASKNRKKKEVPNA